MNGVRGTNDNGMTQPSLSLAPEVTRLKAYPRGWH